MRISVLDWGSCWDDRLVFEDPIGLSYISNPNRDPIYWVADEPIFMLAAIKHGIKFEIL
jgi:hypothetical protein